MAADWKKIKAEYLRGGVSYRELAKKYGVSFSTLRKVASKEKWTDLRNKVEAKKDTKIVESIASREAKKDDMFQTISDKLLMMISNGIDDGSIVVTSRGLRDITGALKDIREIKGIKNDLDLQEQIARIDRLKRDAARDDVDDSDKYGIVLLPPIMEQPTDE